MAEPEEQEVSWRAIVARLPVVASDGKEVGTVLDVAALPEEDIFHGVVFKPSALTGGRLVLADDVARITDRAVYLGIDSAAAGNCGEFHEEHIEGLGVKGLFFWKHLGWTKRDE